jgi:proteasome activator subunit 4
VYRSAALPSPLTWCSPLERTTRARLARIYFHVAVLPGLETRIVELAANTCMALIE